MRDGYTRKIEREDLGHPDFLKFIAANQASIVVVAGDDAGSEFVIDRAQTTIGRGRSVDVCFQDEALSSEHAAIEFTGDGFRLRDLGSMNGTLLNGGDVKAGDLKHGDRFQLGARTFQFVVTPREKRPRTWEIPVE